MTSPLDTVVVGVDGSPLSAAALRWASERVPAGRAVHVVHALAPAAELAAAAFQVAWMDRRRQVEADLAGPWTAPAREAGRTVQVHLVDDDPSRALLQVVRDHRATAVVIGVHGAGGRHRPLLGGVTRRILHRSTVPVIVVNDGGDQASEAPEPPPVAVPVPTHVTVGVGYGDASDQAVQWAATYALARHLPLELVHAVATRPILPAEGSIGPVGSYGPGGSYLDPEVDLAWAADDLALIQEHLRDLHPELVTTVRVELGSTVERLLPAAAGAEVVVAGKRHGDRLARLTISPRLRHLIIRARCPTVIVPSWTPTS